MSSYRWVLIPVFLMHCVGWDLQSWVREAEAQTCSVQGRLLHVSLRITLQLVNIFCSQLTAAPCRTRDAAVKQPWYTACRLGFRSLHVVTPGLNPRTAGGPAGAVHAQLISAVRRAAPRDASPAVRLPAAAVALGGARSGGGRRRRCSCGARHRVRATARCCQTAAASRRHAR